jgi:hypothetical protein
MTLIQRQDEAIKRMLEPRSSERRAEKNRHAALRQYRKHAERMGYTLDQINAQIRDLVDMWRLERDAE